jgi:hypothetical protein
VGRATSVFQLIPAVTLVLWLGHAGLAIAGSPATRYTRWVLFGGLPVVAAAMLFSAGTFGLIFAIIAILTWRNDTPGSHFHDGVDGGEGCPDEEGCMKRREIWGVALLTLAALAAWAGHAIYEAYRAAARDDGAALHPHPRGLDLLLVSDCQNCQLETASVQLRLTCGAITMVV